MKFDKRDVDGKMDETQTSVYIAMVFSREYELSQIFEIIVCYLAGAG